MPAGLGFSLALHAGLLLLAILAVLFAPKSRQPDHVFTMAYLPETGESPGPHMDAPAPSEPTPAPPPSPQRVEPPPPEPAKTSEPPSPAPAPVPETPPPSQDPAPAPAPGEPKRMSIDDFRKQFDQPKTATRPTPPPRSEPRPSPPATVSFDAAAFDAANTQTTTGAAGAPATGSQVSSYFSRIVAAIRANWVNPEADNYALLAVAEFRVNAAGQVTFQRLRTASGNRRFDASVEAAFSGLPAFGKPPDGSPDVVTITFRIRE